MKKLGVSQEEIAKKLGITRVYVNRIINGERSTKRVRQAIADALRMPFEEVWGEKNEHVLHISPTKIMKAKGYVPLFFAIKLGCFGKNRSKTSIYKDAEEGKLDIQVFSIPGKKKRYYFVKVESPVLWLSVNTYNKLKASKKEETKLVRVKLPKDISNDINSISDYRGSGYESFFNFIKSAPDEVVKSTFKFFLGEKVEYVEKRIRIKHDDLKILKDIAEQNNMNLSKVIEILLRGFKTIDSETVSPVEVIEKYFKGGKISDGELQFAYQKLVQES